MVKVVVEVCLRSGFRRVYYFLCIVVSSDVWAECICGSAYAAFNLEILDVCVHAVLLCLSSHEYLQWSGFAPYRQRQMEQPFSVCTLCPISLLGLLSWGTYSGLQTRRVCVCVVGLKKHKLSFFFLSKHFALALLSFFILRVSLFKVFFFFKAWQNDVSFCPVSAVGAPEELWYATAI